MASGRWSIAARTTRRFALTTAALVLAICAVGAAFVDAALDRELEGLVQEELDEMAALFLASPGRVEDFEAIAADLAHNHGANPMAWRVWHARTGELWFERGALDLLTPEAPAIAPLDETLELPRDLRARSTAVASGQVVGIVLDGSAQSAHLARFGLVSLALAAIAGALAFFVGRLFIHRACRMLHDVAENARASRVDGAGQLAGSSGLPEEIREVTLALDQMMRNARAEADRTRLLTTGLAHELGSPVQNLVGEAEVALMEERTAEDYRKVLKSQLEELRDMGRTIGNLMTLCSIDSTRPASGGELERFDLGREADLRLRRERAYAERRGVELEIVPRGGLDIEGDREALLLAVSNLVANAIDWSPEGGHVRCDLSGENGRVEVTVDDAGPGVPDEEREEIFEPFHRGRAAKGRRAGYGLGLAIAKRAVDAHGGEVSVARSPFGGARFQIILPRSPNT